MRVNIRRFGLPYLLRLPFGNFLLFFPLSVASSLGISSFVDNIFAVSIIPVGTSVSFCGVDDKDPLFAPTHFYI